MASVVQWFLSTLLIFSSLGVILAKKPVHAGLSFLLTLLTLSLFYLQLSAQFIAAMQILVYAGAILVIIMFVIILFQDAHQQIAKYQANSSPVPIFVAASTFLLTLVVLGKQFIGLGKSTTQLPQGFGTVQSLGQALYLDFFFPFEAVIVLFLVAVIGAVYIGRKSTS